MDYSKFKAGDWVFITYKGSQHPEQPRFVQLKKDSQIVEDEDGTKYATISIPEKYNINGCLWGGVVYWLVMPDVGVNSAEDTVELATVQHVEKVCEELSDEIEEHNKKISWLQKKQNEVSRLKGVFNDQQ